MDTNNLNNVSEAVSNYNFSNSIIYTESTIRPEPVLNINSNYHTSNNMSNDATPMTQTPQLFANATLDISSSSLNIPGIGKLPGIFTSKPTGEIHFITQTPDNHQLIFLLRSVKIDNSNTDVISPTLISVIAPSSHQNYINPSNFYQDTSNANHIYYAPSNRMVVQNNFMSNQNNQVIPPPLQIINQKSNILIQSTPSNGPIEIKQGNTLLREVTSSTSNIIKRIDHERAFSRFVADVTKGLTQTHINSNKAAILDTLNNKWNSLSKAQRDTYYTNESASNNTNYVNAAKSVSNPQAGVVVLSNNQTNIGSNINTEHSYLGETLPKTETKSLANKVTTDKVTTDKKICFNENCKRKTKPSLNRGEKYCSDECAITHCNNAFKKTFLPIPLAKAN